MSHGVRFRVLLVALVVILLFPVAAGAAQNANPVRLAYVWNDTVTLADSQGQPIESPGPTFGYGQGARLFWTADGQTLYIARDDGLYATGAQGGAAVQIPGYYGRTVAISQDRQVMYYLETVSPQAVRPGQISFPIRDIPVAEMNGGVGRLTGYFGQFAEGATKADLSFAAALYVRDGGLLGPGRPALWPTYGANLFGTCCFPDPGLGMYNTGTGDYSLYDETFISGAAASNSTRTHLAGPTTDGAIRVIDLITGGARDYAIQVSGGPGTIERVTWSPDDTSLYILARRDPQTPLQLNANPPFTVDLRSANIVLYRLNLVNSLIRELAWRPDVYGVSSLAATDNYVFAVVVEPNTALVNALNNNQVRAGALPTDDALRPYIPATHLWRVDVVSGAADDVLDNVWGVTARPIR